MKIRIILIIISFLFFNSILVSQPEHAMDIICDNSGTFEMISGSGPTVINEVVIFAVDFGETSKAIEPWFYDYMNSFVPGFFEASTAENYTISVDILEAPGGLGYEMPVYHEPTWDGCYGAGDDVGHVHLQSNILDVLNQADADYNFGLYDYNGDGVVNVHFISLAKIPGTGSGGILCSTSYISSDYVGGNPIEVRVVRETRGSSASKLKSIYLHESGHSAPFRFRDMDHQGYTMHDHYAIGGFDVMSVGGFNSQASPYNPVSQVLKGWVTPTPITTNNDGFVLAEFQKTNTCYVFEPSTTLPGSFRTQRFYVSYHDYDPIDNLYYQKFPYANQSLGGVLIWHSSVSHIYEGTWSNYKYLPIDIEAAHGKTIWNITSSDVINTGIEDPLNGRDKLEIRKVSSDKKSVLAGPYHGIDKGDASIFYTPGYNQKFNFLSNPNSNFIISSYSENYAQSIVTGFSIENIRMEGSTVKASIKIDDFTIDENTTLPVGIWHINNDIIVASGVTLTIPVGTELKFENSSSLVVNGNLIIQGTSLEPITMDFISHNFTKGNGIRLNSGSSANISNAIVKNAANGIYIDEAYANISNSTFIDCYCGLYIYRTNSSSSQPEITNCTIYNSNYDENLDKGCGIYCIYSSPIILNTEIYNYKTGVYTINNSSPLLGHYTSNGNNNFHNNYNNLYAEGSSNPFLGTTSYGGYNTLRYYTNYSIVVATNCNINAENNYWGSTSSSTIANGLSIGTGCSVDYEPYLYWNPNGNIVLPPAQLSANQISSTTSENIGLSSVNDLILRNKLEEALALCNGTIAESKETSNTLYAIDLLWQIERKMKLQKGKSNIDLFAQLRTDSKNELVAGYTQIIAAVSQKLDRIASLDNVLSNYGSSDIIEKRVLYSKFLFYLNEEQKREKAEEMYNLLKGKYPDAPITEIAFFDLYRGSTLKGQNSLSKKSDTVLDEKITDFALFANYPNPFNPTTQISYQIPEDGFVNLVVYNSLGQIVSTLVKEHQTSGKYSVQLNASNLPSGVYFYKIESGSFTKVSKMLLLR